MSARSAPARLHAAELPDADVVRRVLAGEAELYALLVERHQAVLYRHAVGMVSNPDAAADLVQESLVKGYTSLDSCQDPARFGAWVFRILRNRSLDYLKDRRRKNLSLEEGALDVPSLDDPAGDLDRAEVARAVSAALEALPAPQREAFLLKHVEGHSYEEMAEMLESSVSALKMRVMRAREALQAMLSPGEHGTEEL
ncbi:MAG: sigma-70 family RNA polymerase sigma factor [Gemmatimonadetes bacterium]|nr:sigma-70 family RNA polymerase sigma factor [Gemmatimonadota bacterium]